VRILPPPPGACSWFPMSIHAQLVRCEIIDIDEIEDFGIVIAQHRALGVAQDTELESLCDLSGKLQGGDPARLHAVDTNAFLEYLLSRAGTAA